MDETTAWLLQSRADLRAAGQLAASGLPADRCHAVAKFQQTAEKAIKAVVAALHDAGILDKGPEPDHSVTPYVRALTRLPRDRAGSSTQNHLRGLLDQHTRTGVTELDNLVPRKKPRRNTEYPYPSGAGWTYPAAEDTFTAEEVDRFRVLGHRLLEGVHKLVMGLRRRPR